MADEIARGVLRMEADNSGFDAAMAKSAATAEAAEKRVQQAAKKTGEAVSGRGKDAAKSAGELDAASRRVIQQIEREAITAEKGRIGWLEYRAAQVGASDAAAPMIARMRAAQSQMGSLELSAKQTTAAMRLLPAQITDIVTGLVSGQPAYLVAIQQGGQLKDSFGGIVPAAKALMSVFTPMRLLVGGVAGAVGALAYGYYQGSKEADTFNRVLATTGNVAGLTAGQLMVMARNIDAVVGTQAQAAEALAQFAGVGIDPSRMEQYTTTAIRAEKDLGIAIKDTVAAYKALGEEPVKASEKLNNQYRYLTLAVFDQIRALEEQGRTTEAAQVAQEAFNRAQERMISEGRQNLGYIERGWSAIKDKISDAADALLNFGRNENSAVSQLDRVQRRLAELRKEDGSGLGGPLGTLLNPIRIKNLEAEETRLKGVASAEIANAKAKKATQDAENAAIKARQDNERLLDRTLTKQQQANKAIEQYLENNKRLRAAGASISASQEQRDVAAIRASFNRGGSKKYTDDAATRMLQQAREAEAVLNAQISGEEKLGAAARARIEFEQQIADLKEKKTLTAEQKSILANEQAIRSQLERNEALEKELGLKELIAKKDEERRKAEERFSERAAQIAQQIEESRTLRNDQYERQLGALGLGSNAREQVAAQATIYREFQRLQAQLLKDTPEHMLGSDKYVQESMRIKAALDQALADQSSYYARLRVMNADWSIGMKQAMATYAEDAANVAQQSERVWSGAFKGLEDALTNFVTTGKLSFADLGQFIVAEVNRMIIRTQIIAPLAQQMQGGGGGIFGQIFGNIFGAAIGGGGSASAALNAPGMWAAGGIFGRSGVQAFASGDIVSSPTLFSYGGNRAGVMGEAGYEAIMPVARTSSGELGVKVASSVPARSQTVINMTIVAKDAESFRRSEGQIANRLSWIASRGSRFA